MKFDIAVIGGGPGGYTAAEKAAKEGLSVVLFEKELLGGTCLNRGCIPTKALLHSAETYASFARAQELGIRAENVAYSFAAMHQRKNAIVAALRQGVEKRMRSNKVTVVSGAARIEAPGSISCGGGTYEARDIIIAAGSKVFYPPIPGIDGSGVYNSGDLLEGEGKDFRSLIIIGGGVVGSEFAALYRALGCQVTLLEAADHILPAADRELAQRLAVGLKKQGVAVMTKVMVQKIEGGPGDMRVTYIDRKGAESAVAAEGVLAAAGRRPNLDGLLADGLDLALDHGGVAGDGAGRTSIPHVYIIGDAKARNIQLAHVAAAQAENAVADIVGKPLPLDMSVIPSCVYTNPEIAFVGMTEDEAAAAGIRPKCGKYLTGANGKCLIEGAGSGYVKLVTDSETGRILGGQLVCPRAADMVGELAVAVQRRMTAAELASVIHAHPTFGEMIYGAAELLR